MAQQILQWLPVNPVVAQSTRMDVSDYFQYIYWNTKKLVSNNTEVMDFLARQGQAGKNKTLYSSTLLYRLSTEGVSQIKCMSLPPSRFGLKVYVFQPQRFIL